MAVHSNLKLLVKTLKDLLRILILTLIRRRMNRRIIMIYREISGKSCSEWHRRRVSSQIRSLMRSSGRKTLKLSLSSLILIRSRVERRVDHLLLRREWKGCRRIESVKRMLSLLTHREKDPFLLLLEEVIRLLQLPLQLWFSSRTLQELVK